MKVSVLFNFILRVLTQVSFGHTSDFNSLCSNLPSLTFPPTTATPVTASQVTSSTSVPLPTKTGNGAELNVQSQLGSIGFAIGISLLLRLL